MQASDSYGEALGRRLNASSSAVVTRTLPKSPIAATELRYSDPENILSTPPREEDAFLFGVHLDHYDGYNYWENGRPAPASTLPAGSTIIYEVKRKPTFLLNRAFHSVHFYFPTTALHAIADEAEAPRIDELRYEPAVSHADTFLRNTAGVMLPLFQGPEQASAILVDHLMLAVATTSAPSMEAWPPRRRP